MFCKTIILSNADNPNNNAPKGILTLSKDNGHIKGKIRLYNISALPIGTKIGLYINEQVHIEEIKKKPYHYEFELNKNIDITQSIYCALIDNSQGKKTVVLEGGSFNGFYFTDSPFDAVLEAKDEQLENAIDTAIKESDSCKDCNSCEGCEYKNYFYENYSSEDNLTTLLNDDIDNAQISSIDNISKNRSSSEIDDVQSTSNQNSILLQQTEALKLEILQLKQQLEELKDKPIDNSPENNPLVNENIDIDTSNPNTDEQSNFLNDIIYQLDEMLTRYPADDILNNIIPDSRFVRVDGEKPYVLGIIYEDKMMKYIAYGVPAEYNSLPPADLGQHYQWLPLNPNDVMSDGYFMIYQNALTGSIVQIDFESETIN